MINLSLQNFETFLREQARNAGAKLPQPKKKKDYASSEESYN